MDLDNLPYIQKVNETPLGSSFFPDISGDGQRVTYSRNSGGQFEADDLMMRDFRTDEERVIFANPDTYIDEQKISADGNFITYHHGNYAPNSLKRHIYSGVLWMDSCKNTRGLDDVYVQSLQLGKTEAMSVDRGIDEHDISIYDLDPTLRSKESDQQQTKEEIDVLGEKEKLKLLKGKSFDPLISSGDFVIYGTCRGTNRPWDSAYSLVLRDVGLNLNIPIPGSEGIYTEMIALSPNGRYISFISHDEQDHTYLNIIEIKKPNRHENLLETFQLVPVLKQKIAPMTFDSGGVTYYWDNVETYRSYHYGEGGQELAISDTGIVVMPLKVHTNTPILEGSSYLEYEFFLGIFDFTSSQLKLNYILHPQTPMYDYDEFSYPDINSDGTRLVWQGRCERGYKTCREGLQVLSLAYELTTDRTAILSVSAESQLPQWLHGNQPRISGDGQYSIYTRYPRDPQTKLYHYDLYRVAMDYMFDNFAVDSPRREVENIKIE